MSLGVIFVQRPFSPKIPYKASIKYGEGASFFGGGGALLSEFYSILKWLKRRLGSLEKICMKKMQGGGGGLAKFLRQQPKSH